MTSVAPIDSSTRRTGWSPLPIAVLFCGFVVVGIGLLTVGSAWFVLRGIRSSGAYQDALAAVRRSPDVRGVLGEPIVAGWWVTGSMKVSGPTGDASLSFPVSGPNGKAEVFFEANKRVGEWTVTTLVVRPEGRSALALLPDPQADAAPYGR